MLDGLIDIYLPDFKYASPDLAREYSSAPDYPSVAVKAIAEMYRQTGKVRYDEKGRSCPPPRTSRLPSRQYEGT